MQYSKIGKFIREKRSKMNITLNTFAINSDVDSATLSNFETGKSDVLFQTFVKIAQGFNTSPSDLIKEFENTQ